jgi:putative acetyltransferase
MMMKIRPATSDDQAAIHRVHAAAFPTEAEALLVDRIIAAGHDELSLVAQLDGQIVGHLLFSPVTVEREGRVIAEGLGVAPIAVLPDYQRRGIGRRLIEVGLETLAAIGCPFVVVLGHVEYYPRFGFSPAGARGLDNEYGAGDAFMVLEFEPSSLPAGGGLVKYGREFGEL